MTTYRVTLRDRETETVVGYFNGSWTTDGRRALTLREREAAEATPPACAIAVRATLTSSRSRSSPPQTSRGDTPPAAFTPRGAPMWPMIPALAIVLAQAAQSGTTSTSNQWCFDRGLFIVLSSAS